MFGRSRFVKLLRWGAFHDQGRCGDEEGQERQKQPAAISEETHPYPSAGIGGGSRNQIGLKSFDQLEGKVRNKKGRYGEEGNEERMASPSGRRRRPCEQDREDEHRLQDQDIEG